eukprot:gene29009-5717_t
MPGESKRQCRAWTGWVVIKEKTKPNGPDGQTVSGVAKKVGKSHRCRAKRLAGDVVPIYCAAHSKQCKPSTYYDGTPFFLTCSKRPMRITSAIAAKRSAAGSSRSPKKKRRRVKERVVPGEQKRRTEFFTKHQDKSAQEVEALWEKEKVENAPPRRPTSAYFYFCKRVSQKFRDEVEKDVAAGKLSKGTHASWYTAEAARRMGAAWSALTKESEDKIACEELQAKDQERYKREKAEYDKKNKKAKQQKRVRASDHAGLDYDGGAKEQQDVSSGLKGPEAAAKKQRKSITRGPSVASAASAARCSEVTARERDDKAAYVAQQQRAQGTAEGAASDADRRVRPRQESPPRPEAEAGGDSGDELLPDEPGNVAVLRTAAQQHEQGGAIGDGARQVLMDKCAFVKKELDQLPRTDGTDGARQQCPRAPTAQRWLNTLGVSAFVSEAECKDLLSDLDQNCRVALRAAWGFAAGGSQMFRCVTCRSALTRNNTKIPKNNLLWFPCYNCDQRTHAVGDADNPPGGPDVPPAAAAAAPAAVAAAPAASDPAPSPLEADPDNEDWVPMSERKKEPPKGKVWEPRTRPIRNYARHQLGHPSRVKCLAVDPTRALCVCRLAPALHDRVPALCNLKTGVEHRTFTSHQDTVVSVALSPDRKHLMNGCRDGMLILWDSVSGVLIEQLDHPGGMQ